MHTKAHKHTRTRAHLVSCDSDNDDVDGYAIIVGPVKRETCFNPSEIRAGARARVHRVHVCVLECLYTGPPTGVAGQHGNDNDTHTRKTVFACHPPMPSCRKKPIPPTAGAQAWQARRRRQRLLTPTDHSGLCAASRAR